MMNGQDNQNIHPQLRALFPVADMIAGTFGASCEAVVHDLTRPENSVVYVANGTVTGRQVGQSFEHLVRQVLMNKDFRDDRVIGYTFEHNGRNIRSSSALVRDEEGQVIGMLCVNVDTTAAQQLQEALEVFLGSTPAPAAPVTVPSGEVSGNVAAILDNLIDRIVGTDAAENLSRRKCVELVGFMDEKGIFLVKGAVDKVAARMGVSRVTVYSYLDEARGKR